MNDIDEIESMPEEVDFTDSASNPYADCVLRRRRVSIGMDFRAIDYFMEESRRVGISFQDAINMCLLECVEEQKHIKFV